MVADIEKIERVNEHGVWMTEFVVGEKMIGRLFRTMHPTIQFEVFNEPLKNAHRCNSIDDAERWLSQKASGSRSRTKYIRVVGLSVKQTNNTR